MNSGPGEVVRRSDGATQATSGEFAGWWRWDYDHFENNSGPFWQRQEEDGSVRCAFRVERRHINREGAIHGGCLMSFADFSLFLICRPGLEGSRGVTLSFSCEFIDAAYEGELIEAKGDLIRAARTVVFGRGVLTSAGRPLLSFSGTIKRIKAPPKLS